MRDKLVRYLRWGGDLNRLKMEDITKYGIIGTIALLLGFSGSLLLSQDQIDKAYVCTTNENLAFFDRLSSTGKTGYYTNESGSLKSNICTNGQWVKLVDYANSRGIDPESFLIKETPIQYRCNQKECVRIN